jgi:hypothetical protein
MQAEEKGLPLAAFNAALVVGMLIGGLMAYLIWGL